LDLVIAPIPPAKQVSKIFHFEELVAYPMLVVGRADHPLRKCTKLVGLAGARWIAGYSTSSKQSTLEELYLEYGLPKPAIAVHADAITLVLARIASSDMLGLLPRPLFENWPQKLFPLPISDPIRPVRLGLITLAGTPLTPIAEKFVGFVRERASLVAKEIASQRHRQ